jgi:pyroglutamyl-peptidase
MARPRVLITGFGPFPGAPDNPSAWLAETLAADTLGLDCEPQFRVLPTEWESVAALTPRLYESLQPHVMIHFGLNRRAQGLRLERSAHNRVCARADACGAKAEASPILPQGPDRIDTDFPVTALAVHLRTRGLAASSSRSCGRYLCNFLYYRSLHWAARQETPIAALFVHIPPLSAQGGSLSQTALLHGAQEILRFALAHAGRRDAHPETNFPLLPPAFAEAKPLRLRAGRCGGARSRDFARAEGSMADEISPLHPSPRESSR